MRVVISQSMYFPWVGLLEQIRLADTFVHYDDVQITRGFYNRVQIKAETATRWLTVPTKKHPRECNIDEVLLDDSQDWRQQHRRALFECYRSAPHLQDMLEVADRVFAAKASTLADVSRQSIHALVDYFGLGQSRTFVSSSSIAVPGRSSQRLLAICRSLGATTYITGHGARNYLDHDIFERAGVRVEYMDYRKVPYPQLHGEFTPYVTGLDLIANCGRDGARFVCSETVSWREFTNGSP